MYRHCVYVLMYICIYIYIHNNVEVKLQGEGGEMGFDLELKTRKREDSVPTG